MARRAFPLVVRLGLLLLLAGCEAQAPKAAPEPAPAPPGVAAVLSVGMTVRDMDRSVAFYTDVLSFTKVSDVEVAGSDYEQLTGVFGVRLRVVRLRLGDEFLDLSEYLARGRPMPVDTHANDRWFQHVAIIVRDMDEAYKHLRKHKVEHASSGPQRLPDWNKNAHGIQAFYFRDPDGHYLEVLHFPPEKGDARWHRPTEHLFLGIDHSALVVSDTEASLRFYRDRLGFKIVGESENYGTEQEHLNNVFGARLRITSLRAAKGPGIEFLEYLAPGDGRPFPSDSRANDLWHWQVRLQSLDADTSPRTVQGGVGRRVSAGVVGLGEGQLGFSKGFLARDPDGHALLFTDK